MASTKESLEAARSKLRTATTVVRTLPTPVSSPLVPPTLNHDEKVTGSSSSSSTDDIVEYSDDELRRMRNDHFSTNMDLMLTSPIPTDIKSPTSSTTTDSIVPTLPLITHKLTVAQAEALLVLHRNRHQPWTRRRHTWQNMSHINATKEFDALAAILQTIMNDMPQLALSYTGYNGTNGDHHKGAFVKLSCRSAKDVEPSSDTRDKLYNDALHSIDPSTHMPQYGHVDDTNARICALYQAHIHSLRYSTNENGSTIQL
jgi:hypothetical protein